MKYRQRKRYDRRKKKRELMFVGATLFVLLTALLVFGLALKALITPAAATVEEIVPEKQTRLSSAEFIQRLLPTAQALHAEFGVLPSIILGQASLESDWGNSQLAAKYNNLFGIKASGDQDKVTLETQEFVNEEWITIQGDFRVYSSWEESMRDHALLFVNGVSWDAALYAGVLSAQNYQEAAAALQAAGYATDPGYAAKIIEVIEAHQLNQYD